MKIFFIGTVEFSLQALKKLIASGAKITGVATKAASAFNADYASLEPVCKENNIPYKHVNDINHPNNINFIRSCNPDIIYCFGWSSLLKEELLQLAPKGVIGFHPAALPHNRGRHPIIWALALGLPETASTFFFMDGHADTGDILSQEKITISETDTAATLYKKIITAALNQIEVFTRQLAADHYSRIRQDQASGNSWRKRGKKDGQIDFRMSSLAIYNLIRALTKPYVGAHIETENGEYKIWQVEISDCPDKNIEPGKVLGVHHGTIKVKTYDGAILLVEHDVIPLPQPGDYL